MITPILRHRWNVLAAAAVLILGLAPGPVRKATSSSARKENKLHSGNQFRIVNAIAKTMPVAVLVALGLSLTAWAAEAYEAADELTGAKSEARWQQPPVGK